MLTLSFRIAEAADVPACADLYRRSVLALAPQRYTRAQVDAWSQAPTHVDRFADFILKPTTLLACHDRQLVGFCGIEPDGHIASLYTCPDHARQGVGGALLGQAIARGRSLGCVRLYTEASRFSQPLFARYGFVVDHVETVDYNGVAFDRAKMVLTL